MLNLEKRNLEAIKNLVDFLGEKEGQEAYDLYLEFNKENINFFNSLTSQELEEFFPLEEGATDEENLAYILIEIVDIGYFRGTDVSNLKGNNLYLIYGGMPHSGFSTLEELKSLLKELEEYIRKLSE